MKQLLKIVFWLIVAPPALCFLIWWMGWCLVHIVGAK